MPEPAAATQPTSATLPNLRGEFIAWTLEGQAVGAWRALGGFPHKTFLIAPGAAHVRLEGSNDQTHVGELLDTLALPIKGAGIYPVEAHVLWVRPVNLGAAPVVVQVIAYREGL